MADELAGLHDLRYKAHIIHHDISLGNLMYERLDDGKIWLILNDFDLAVMVDDSGLPARPAPRALGHARPRERARAAVLARVAHEPEQPRLRVQPERGTQAVAVARRPRAREPAGVADARAVPAGRGRGDEAPELEHEEDAEEGGAEVR